MEDLKLVILADCQIQVVKVNRPALLRVYSAQVDCELAVNEYKHVVVAREGKGLASTILEDDADLGCEKEVVVPLSTAVQSVVVTAVSAIKWKEGCRIVFVKLALFIPCKFEWPCNCRCIGTIPLFKIESICIMETLVWYENRLSVYQFFVDTPFLPNPTKPHKIRMSTKKLIIAKVTEKAND